MLHCEIHPIVILIIVLLCIFLAGSSGVCNLPLTQKKLKRTVEIIKYCNVTNS